VQHKTFAAIFLYLHFSYEYWLLSASVISSGVRGEHRGEASHTGLHGYFRPELSSLGSILLGNLSWTESNPIWYHSSKVKYGIPKCLDYAYASSMISIDQSFWAQDIRAKALLLLTHTHTHTHTAWTPCKGSLLLLQTYRHLVVSDQDDRNVCKPILCFSPATQHWLPPGNNSVRLKWFVFFLFNDSVCLMMHLSVWLLPVYVGWNNVMGALDSTSLIFTITHLL